MKNLNEKFGSKAWSPIWAATSGMTDHNLWYEIWFKMSKNIWRNLGSLIKNNPSANE